MACLSPCAVLTWCVCGCEPSVWVCCVNVVCGVCVRCGGCKWVACEVCGKRRCECRVRGVRVSAGAEGGCGWGGAGYVLGGGMRECGCML